MPSDTLPAPEAPALDPLLLQARAAATACGVSPATWWRWEAAGKIPAAVRIGSTVRWRRAELAAWTAAGCPSRAEWQALQATAQRNGRPR